MTDLASLDATAQAALVASGELTPVELVEAAIERCEARNPELNAVIHPAFDRARDLARDPPDGPFRGVPMLIKDLVCKEAGLPFHEGSRYLQEIGWTPEEDQVLARRFRAGGLVPIGRTNTSEFGMRPACEPLAYGPTLNPRAPGRSTGGSSGGSAAAVAAGIVPMAHANDIGGSIRIPASMCGLLGLKPSRGRSALAPDFFDVMGGLGEELVVARSVRDIATALDVVTGPVVGDWHPTWPAAASFASFASAAAANPPRLRVGFLPSSPRGPIDPAISDAVRTAASTLEGLGHRVEETHPAALAEELDPFLLAHYTAGTAWVVDHHWPRLTGRPIPAELVEPDTALLADLGRAVSGAQLLEARELAQAWTRRLSAWFDRHDVLVLPTVPMLPPALGSASVAQDVELISLVAPFNVSGHPAMSLPLGEHQGIPIGVQFVAGHGNDALLLQLADQVLSAG